MTRSLSLRMLAAVLVLRLRSSPAKLVAAAAPVGAIHQAQVDCRFSPRREQFAAAWQDTCSMSCGSPASIRATSPPAYRPDDLSR